MKKYLTLIAIILIATVALTSCELFRQLIDKNDYVVNLDLNTDFEIADTLPDGEGRELKVVVLIGQSNASGASRCEYLKLAVGDEKYQKYEQGFENTLINFCVDDWNNTSNGEFRPVNTECGAAEGFFGPEIGMAEVLSEAFPEEQLVILKYTYSGTDLNYRWLSRGERGSIYKALKKFIDTSMTYLLSKNYRAEIGAVCWMQGESDTNEYKAARYYKNTAALVEYLREDLAEYARSGGIYFIDAGISDSSVWQPENEIVNEAKKAFAETSPLNIYFSTIDLGLTCENEPNGEPDLAHYDAPSELELGREFGRIIASIYSNFDD